MSLTSEQIQSNWKKLKQLINDTFDDERSEKLNTMYKYFEDRMMLVQRLIIIQRKK